MSSLSLHPLTSEKNGDMRFNARPVMWNNSNCVGLAFCSDEAGQVYGDIHRERQFEVSIFNLSDVDAEILSGVGRIPPERRAELLPLIREIIKQEEPF